MSEPTLVNVTVTFERGTIPGFTYSHGAAEGVMFGGSLNAHATLSGNAQGPHNWAFIFQLAGTGVGDALVWDNPPIVWTSGVPPTLESGFVFPTPSANQVVVGVHNDNTGEFQEKFGFRFKVVSNGEHVESPDPEIILDPP
jgi:hypothetical protein